MPRLWRVSCDKFLYVIVCIWWLFIFVRYVLIRMTHDVYIISHLSKLLYHIILKHTRNLQTM